MVKIDSLYVFPSRGDVITGYVSVADAIETAMFNCRKLFGTDRPILLIEPEGNKWNQTHIVWLVDDDHKPEPTDSGSHLFVIWFAEETTERPLQNAMHYVDNAGGWIKRAASFNT